MANYGLYINGQITEGSQFNVIKDYVRGVTFNFEWGDYETSAGVFDDSYIETQLALADTYSFKKGISISIAPATGNTTPSWLFSAPYSVPKVITTNGEYPYYLNSTFKTRKWLMITHLLAYLEANHPDIYYYQSKNGKTGDWGNYSGTITSVTINGVAQEDIAFYDITDTEWKAYQEDEVWGQLYSTLAGQFTAPNGNMLMNAGNDFIDFQWGLDNVPNTFFKFGMPTHTYSNSFEKYYAQYGRGLWAMAAAVNRTRGEGQGFPTWFTDHSIANFWAMMGSLLHQGVDIFSITSGLYATLMGTDVTPIQFLNRHAGNRLASASNCAFCMLRQMIDVADTATYTVADYGALIDPTKLAAYTNQYNNIVGAGYPIQYEQSRLTDLLLSNSNLNPARLTALQAAFPTALYHTISNSEDQDAYSQEFGVNLIPDNYYNFIVQYSPDTTSTGGWRQANRRYYRIPDPEMFFTFSDGLVSGITEMDLHVEYIDSGTDTWELFYWNGTAKTSAGVITKTNTGVTITEIFSITDLVGGGNLENNSDFTITGETTKFTLIEALNIVNNQNMPFSQNYTASQTIGLPSQIVLTDTSTGSDGAITQRRVFFEKADGTYLVPSGTTTDYVVWSYSASSKIFDLLNGSDAALSITVQWLNVSNTVLYSKATLWPFLLYQQQFLLTLTQSQIAAGLTTPAQLYNSNYYPAKVTVWLAVQDATNAVEIGNNIYDAQSAVNTGMYIVNNPNLLY